MVRLVLYGFVVLLLVVSVARSSAIRGKITPSTPSAFFGRNLTLNCTLKGNITDDISARDVYFEFTNPDVRLKSVTQVINNRTVRLDIRGVYLNMSSSRISCRLRNYTLDEVDIVVDKPQFPNATECIVYNWERMACTWEMEETENMTISMVYSRSNRCDMRGMYLCPNPMQKRGGGSCTWHPREESKSFYYMNHCLWFRALNAYNATALSRSKYVVVAESVSNTVLCDQYGPKKWNVQFHFNEYYSRLAEWFDCPKRVLKSCLWDSSQDDEDQFFEATYTVALYRKRSEGKPELLRKTQRTYDSKLIVKPNRVRIEWSKNASDHIDLSWASPNAAKHILFRVAYVSRFSSTLIRNTSETSITLSNLVPNTKYTITIDCIPVVKRAAIGYWSDEETREITTAPDVPGDSPSVTPGGFLVLERKKSKRELKLFFRPVDDIRSHGEVKGYRVRYGNSTEFKNSVPTTNVILSLEMEETYVVSVEMQNVVGYNESLAPKTVVIGRQSELPSFPENFVVQTDDQGTYILNWTLVDQASSYTLYWCSSSFRQFECKNPLSWKVLPPNQTSEVLQVVGLPDLTVRFALSVEIVTANGETVSSGMWIANCTYSKSGELKPPEGTKATRMTEDTISVDFVRPDRTASFEQCNGIAYASRYRIAYCREKHCQEREVDSFRDSVTINGLDAGETYMFRIWSLSEDGNLSAAASLVNMTLDKNEQTGQRDIPVGVIVVVVVIVVALCAVPVIVKFVRWWKKKWHIDVKTPPKYNNTQTPSAETIGYSTFLRSDLDSGGQVQTTACGFSHSRVSHGYFNSASFQPGEDEDLLSRHHSEYKSSTSSSEMSTMPSTQSNSASSKSSDPRRDSGISNSISGYNVVIEQPCESSGSSRNPCEEDAVATTEIC